MMNYSSNVGDGYETQKRFTMKIVFQPYAAPEGNSLLAPCFLYFQLNWVEKNISDNPVWCTETEGILQYILHSYVVLYDHGQINFLK